MLAAAVAADSTGRRWTPSVSMTRPMARGAPQELGADRRGEAGHDLHAAPLEAEEDETEEEEEQVVPEHEPPRVDRAQALHRSAPSRSESSSYASIFRSRKISTRPSGQRTSMSGTRSVRPSPK